MLHVALNLAAKGCRVFPVVSTGKGKRPGIKGWPKYATTNVQTITKWWKSKRFENASVGIHPVGYIVIDIDGPVGEENFQRLKQTHPFPDTIKVISGNSEPHDLWMCC